MVKKMIIACVLTLGFFVNTMAQDDKNNAANKNNPSTLEDHKNGGKKDESAIKSRPTDVNTEKKSEHGKLNNTEKKDIPKYDKKPH